MGLYYHFHGVKSRSGHARQWREPLGRTMRAVRCAGQCHLFGAAVSAPLLELPGVPGREQIELSPRERCTSPPRHTRRCLRIRKRRLSNLSAWGFAIRQQPAKSSRSVGQLIFPGSCRSGKLPSWSAGTWASLISGRRVTVPRRRLRVHLRPRPNSRALVVRPEGDGCEDKD
jgi:hypothetical protein